MSYMINKLSAIKVRSVTRPGMYGDGAGLWLQVSKSGAKSWIFRYDFFGRRREMGLGSCHTVDLALARAKAKACRLELLEKRDPIEERDKARAEYVHQQAKRVTFDECASAYISAHCGSWKSAKHAAQWETTIAAYVSPIIGALPVAEVDTALVVKVLRPIWTTKTETATRLRGRIESILDWATTHKSSTSWLSWASCSGRALVGAVPAMTWCDGQRRRCPEYCDKLARIDAGGSCVSDV